MRMSTGERSTRPMGWSSWSYVAARAARTAGSSPEAASFLASMPVWRAFLREMALPGSVRGPGESCALERLARIWFWVAIRSPSATTVASERGRFRGVGRQVIEGEGRNIKTLYLLNNPGRDPKRRQAELPELLKRSTPATGTHHL